MTTETMQTERFWLLSWLVLPVISVWFAVSYVFGEINLPAWEKPPEISTQQAALQRQESFDWNGEGLVTIWFDDAYVTQYTVAAPLLASKSMVGSLAVPTKTVGTPGYMNWRQVQNLSFQGWDINAHTRTHSCELDKADENTLIDELAGSQSDLAAKNIFTNDFVTPCGVENEAMKTVAKKYFRSLRTSFHGVNEIPLKDPYAIKAYPMMNTTTVDDVRRMVDEAKSGKTWVILMYHQIDESGTEYTVLPTDLREMLEVVEESGLQVVTPSQVLSIESAS